MIGIDGLTELVRDMSNAPGKVQRQVVPVVVRGAFNVVKDWRQRSSGLSHAPAYPYSVTFDTRWKGSSFEAEVGPDKSLAQGALGNLIEYGSANNPPHGDGAAALNAEGPRFVKAMEDLGDL